MSKKCEIRKFMLEERAKLSNKYVMESGILLLNKLSEFNFVEKYKIIFIYVSMKNEVSTIETINFLIENNITVCVPKIFDKDIMQAVKIRNPEKDLCSGKFGTYEPKSDDKKDIINGNDIELAIVPGVAFDRSGNRIGFGSGYYDKYFSKISKKIFKAGVCYNFQLLDSIPFDENDVKMDEIITV